ncbi:hypothetical protein SVIOM74S_01957 [Streptomyces violarus]
MLLPLIARAGIAASGLANPAGTRGSWRATWAYAPLLTITTAFTPVVWPVALVLGAGVLALRRAEITAYGLRFLAQLGTPLLLLAPWSLSLLPFGFFDEAGLEYGASAASALDLLGAGPGGPGTVGGLFLIGIVLAALAALLRSERRLAVRRPGPSPWSPWSSRCCPTAPPGPAPPPSSTASPCCPPPRSAPTERASGWPSRASAGASPSPP